MKTFFIVSYESVKVVGSISVKSFEDAQAFLQNSNRFNHNDYFIVTPEERLTENIPFAYTACKYN